MRIYIIRNNQRYGPYDEQTLQSYANQGQVLKHDKAIAEGDNQERTVGFYLKKNHLKSRVANKGNVFSQLQAIGSELIFPRTSLLPENFLSDQRFLIMALVGLLPTVFMNIPLRGFFLFYEISLYFAIIWGLFFYACFKTVQVKLKTTLSVFFLLQLCVFVVWDLLGLPRFNPFYALTHTTFPINIAGYVLGVGLTEEFAKMLPLLFILWKAKEPLIPQTMVFYGLMSGISFGVYEGVQYQMTINAQQTYDISFFLNIARLTSLPFLHACWCGIAGYFLSFANLYPKYRRGLYLLSLCIPALLHGLYDALSGYRIISSITVFAGLMLLTVYLRQSVDYQSKLRQ